MANKLYLPDSCTTLTISESTFCLPPVVSCNTQPTNELISLCDELWNCNFCRVDKAYFLPYVQGDKIQIQSQFFDFASPDAANPTATISQLLNIFLCQDGIETPLTPSRAMNAYGCGKNYQIIEIDTSNITGCFNLRYEVKNSSGGVVLEYCTNHYAEVKESASTFTISSKRTSSTDCNGFCYGGPDNFVGDFISYNDEIRLKGFLRTPLPTVTNTIIGNRYTKSVKREVYSLQLSESIPPYVSSMLCRVLGGGIVCINGEDFNIDEFTITNSLTRGKMLRYSIDSIYRECENYSTNCV